MLHLFWSGGSIYFGAEQFVHVFLILAGDFFYRCDAFSSSIKWYSGSDFFIIVNSSVEASLKNKRPKFGPACAQTYLYAASSGRAVLHATFSSHVNNGYSRQISLKASAPVAAFSPLMVHQARDGNKFGGYWFDLEEKGTHIGLKNLKNLYLTPGSYSNVVLVGGPERWRKDIDYIQKVDVLDELCSLPKDGALVQQVKNSEGNEYIILCQVLGNFVSPIVFNFFALKIYIWYKLTYLVSWKLTLFSDTCFQTWEYGGR